MADHTQIFCIDVFCMLELRISSRKERKKGKKRLSLVLLFVTVFIFAHTSCTLCSASDILSLQMPHSRLSTVGSCTYYVFSPSVWNDLPLPLWQKWLIQISSKNFFPQKNCRPARFSVPCRCLHPFQVFQAFAARFELCLFFSFVWSECVCRCLCVCVCVCVCMCACARTLRIISRDKILRFKNTFMITNISLSEKLQVGEGAKVTPWEI